MRNSLALLHRPEVDPARDPDCFPPGVLAELLALNEEMIEQLCLERQGAIGQVDLLTRLIDQHERTAELLRAQLTGSGSQCLASECRFQRLDS